VKIEGEIRKSVDILAQALQIPAVSGSSLSPVTMPHLDSSVTEKAVPLVLHQSGKIAIGEVTAVGLELNSLHERRATVIDLVNENRNGLNGWVNRRFSAGTPVNADWLLLSAPPAKDYRPGFAVSAVLDIRSKMTGSLYGSTAASLKANMSQIWRIPTPPRSATWNSSGRAEP
jgi:hypothetical protein